MHSYFSCYLWSEMLLEVNGKNLVVVHLILMAMFSVLCLFDAVMQCLSLNPDVYGMAI